MVASVLKTLLKEEVPDLRKINHVTKKIMLRPKLQKVFFKVMTKIWSEDEDSRRILAFLNILKGLECNLECTSLCIKLMFIAYVKNCKFVLGSTLPHINFMRQSLLELLSRSLDEAYIHAFAYIRQLAIVLRKAYTTHLKEDTQAVQNWQFVNSLRLWTDLVAKHAGSHQLLQSLVHPLVQLIVATVKLNPGERWIPLRFHCVEMLHILAGVPALSESVEPDKDSTSGAVHKPIPLSGHALIPTRRVLVPSLPLLLDIFQLVNFNRRASAASKAPLDLRLLLHFSPSQRRETASLDAVLNWLIDLLTEAASIQANSVVFPEFALPMINALKQFVHTCRVSAFTRQAKALLTKIREHSDWMQLQRRRLRSLGNSDDVVQFESSLTVLDGSVKAPPFWSFYLNHKQVRATELAHLTKCHQKDVLASDEQPEDKYLVDRKKTKRTSTRADDSEDSDDSDASDASYDLDDGVTVTHVSKSKNNSAQPDKSSTKKTTPVMEPSAAKPVDDQNASEDSDFDLEAALNEPEEIEDEDSDDVAPDQVTDFELSESDDDDDDDDIEDENDDSDNEDTNDDEGDESDAEIKHKSSNFRQHKEKSREKKAPRSPGRHKSTSGPPLPTKKTGKRQPGRHPPKPAPKKMKFSAGKSNSHKSKHHGK